MKRHILKEFMYSNECKFPKTIGSSQFSKDLSTELGSFSSRLSSIPNDSIVHSELLKRLDELNRFTSAIDVSLNLYLNGKFSKAQQQFYHAMEWLNTHYDVGKRNYDYHSFPGMFGSMPEFYRAAATQTSDVARIFHLPYELRGNAAGQRFNIPGMPCLYLGKSLYVCRQELNARLEDLSFSRYEVNTDKIDYLKFWNFAEPPSLIFDVFQFLLFSCLLSVSLAFQDLDLLPDNPLILQGHKAMQIELKEVRKNTTFGSEGLPQEASKITEYINTNGKKTDFFFQKYDIDESLLCHAVCENYDYFTGTLFKDHPTSVLRVKNGYGLLQTGIAEVINGIMLHPLKIALTIKVENYSFPFKFSYILPQFFMQWLSERNIADANNLYGVSYLSSKIQNANEIASWDLNLFRNYAFPSIPRQHGYCEKLIDFFSVTEPTNLLQALNTSDFNMSNFSDHNPNSNCVTEEKIAYSKTLEYKIEQYLQGKETKPLTSFALNSKSTFKE